FNALVDENRQIVISADKSPSDLERIEERMRSRLGWGLVADLHPTTYELRLGILQSKAEQGGLRIPPKAMEFLAHKITSNVRELAAEIGRHVRRPRPPHVNARGAQDGGAEGHRSAARRGCRAAARDAERLSARWAPAAKAGAEEERRSCYSAVPSSRNDAAG